MKPVKASVLLPVLNTAKHHLHQVLVATPAADAAASL